MSSERTIVLASGSPRRRELLTRAGVDFEVSPSGLDEVRGPDESAREYALRMATEKAAAVSAKYPGRTVLAADTVVECGGEILEKPADPKDAHRMLRTLSGRDHVVITGFAIARDGVIIETGAPPSTVTFRELSAAEIDAYIETKEPFDKAGAYGIQGIGGGFIARVAGSRDNVMGLPVDEVVAALRRLGF